MERHADNVPITFGPKGETTIPGTAVPLFPTAPRVAEYRDSAGRVDPY
jgi:hypothetical protein